MLRLGVECEVEQAGGRQGWVRASEALRGDVRLTRALEKVELPGQIRGSRWEELMLRKWRCVNTCSLFPDVWAARYLWAFEEVTQTREQ